MTETVTIAGAGIVLDLLLWRRFGDKGIALVEETLALNPGLAAVGPILPAGTVVVLPEAPPAGPAAMTAIDLFS